MIPLSIFSITQSTPIKATVCCYLHFKYLFLKFVYKSYFCASLTGLTEVVIDKGEKLS